MCVFIHAGMSEHFISMHARIDDLHAPATGHFAGKPSIRGRLWSECKETHVSGSLWSRVCVCVCVARGDDKAIKPYMSNINCFDLFPLRLVALCRQGTFLIWTENSVKVCKILEGWKMQENNEGEFYSLWDKLKWYWIFYSISQRMHKKKKKKVPVTLNAMFVCWLVRFNAFQCIFFYVINSVCCMIFNKILIKFKRGDIC